MTRVLLQEHLSSLSKVLTWRTPDEITDQVRQDMIVLDVRERHEFESVRIPDSRNLTRASGTRDWSDDPDVLATDTRGLQEWCESESRRHPRFA